MAVKSYVVTSTKRLDAFLENGRKLGNLELRVGQLSGKPRYPLNYRSTKTYDDPGRRVPEKELARRSAIRSLRTQLSGMNRATRKLAEKDIRKAFRAQKISSKGLTTKRRTQGTQVAKVAGVLHAGTVFHVRALEAHAPHIQAECEAIAVLLHAGKSPVPIIRGIGRSARDAVRASIHAEGHVDSGRMLKTTQFEVMDRVSKAWHQRAARARRAAVRAAKRKK